MKVIKNIHNNVSLCLDSKGNEVIAFGKGIGFKKPPCDVPMSSIERTFYNVDPMYIDIFSQIPEEIVNISTDIVDYANSLLHGRCNNSNLVFTLADHIQFSIKRNKNSIYIKLPLVHEVRQMYPKEIKIGEFALKHIEEKLGIKLPKAEVAVITLHVMSYGLTSENDQTTAGNQSMIDQCTSVVEEYMGLKIDKDGFNYSRFVLHMYYLLERVSKNENVSTDNRRIFEELIAEYPKTYECAKKIRDVLNAELNEEELVYLVMHINRLCNRQIGE